MLPHESIVAVTYKQAPDCLYRRQKLGAVYRDEKEHLNSICSETITIER